MEWYNKIKSFLSGIELEKTSAPQDAAALDAFVYNLYQAEGITAEQSKKNLATSVVRVFQEPRRQTNLMTLSNGLLITYNGYFVTAKHCLDLSNATQTVSHCGQKYPVERICVRSEKEDLVIAKAAIPGKCEPVIYKISPERQLKEKKPVTVLTRKKGPLQILGGYVIQNHNDFVERKTGIIYSNHAVLDIEVEDGHSGSPVVDVDGTLLGIISGRILAKNVTIGTCSKAYRTLELITILSQHYKNNGSR